MNLGELFQREVVTVSPQSSLVETVTAMRDENVGAVVVVDQGRVVGIVTDRDVALAVALGDANPSTPVENVMTRGVVTMWEDEGLLNATETFMNQQVRRLPIVTRDGALVGMVTTDDLLTLLAREVFNVSKAVAPAMAD